MRALTKEEARELVDWKDSVFKDAMSTVIARWNPAWSQYSEYILFPPRQNGKTGIVFDVMVDAAVQHIAETMAPDELNRLETAIDYEEILCYDEEESGFDSMAEAYAAGVPVEDIVA